MGARRGSKSWPSPTPGKFVLLYGRSFHYFFLLMGGLLLHVGAILLLFSRCGGFFSPYGGGGELLMKYAIDNQNSEYLIQSRHLPTKKLNERARKFLFLLIFFLTLSNKRNKVSGDHDRRTQGGYRRSPGGGGA